MKLFKRFTDLVRANLNDLLDKAEDPEKMINLFIEDAEEQLVAAKAALHTALTSQKKLGAQIAKKDKEISDLQKLAESAVEKGGDAKAKKWLEKKKLASSSLTSLTAANESAEKTTGQARSQVEQLEAKIEEAKAKAGTLIARSQAAAAQKKSSEALGKISSDPLGSFSSLEGKIEQREAEAAAAAEVAGMGDDSVASAMRDLESGDVDHELAALKVKAAKKKKK